VAGTSADSRIKCRVSWAIRLEICAYMRYRVEERKIKGWKVMGTWKLTPKPAFSILSGWLPFDEAFDEASNVELPHSSESSGGSPDKDSDNDLPVLMTA